MLNPQEQLPLSNHIALYDLIIPQYNLLRRINDLIDFSFVYDELSPKYCSNNGRTAQNPIRMFKYLLLKTIYDLSDVDVVERSMYDMSFKYFLGMVPEESVIDASTLCKFRKLRLKDMDLLSLLIGKTVSIAIDKGIIKSKSIIVDATHSGSRSNPFSPIEILRLRSKQLRKSLYEVDDDIKRLLPAKSEKNELEAEITYTQSLIECISDKATLIEMPKIREKLNMLKETINDIADHYTISKDADARIGHKSEDSSFFGYKTHIAMSEERIITAAVVTSGEKGDGPVLPSLVDESRKNGMEIETVIGDCAYSGDKNLKKAKAEGFEVVARLSPSISHGFRGKDDTFDYNKDAGMFVCTAGHLAIRRAKQGRKCESSNQVYVYYFDVEKCKVCSRRDGCYKNGAKTKSYSITIKTAEQQTQIEFQQSEHFRAKSKERYKIEAKNWELKHVFGYDRAESYGLLSMQLQGAMAIFAANIKRILKVM